MLWTQSIPGNKLASQTSREISSSRHDFSAVRFNANSVAQNARCTTFRRIKSGNVIYYDAGDANANYQDVQLQRFSLLFRDKVVHGRVCRRGQKRKRARRRQLEAIRGG